MKNLTLRCCVVALAWGSLLVACSSPGHSVFTAQPFDPEAACLAEYEPIALVETTVLRANCRPICFEFDGTVYVTTLCGPYPESITHLSNEDETCAAALSAPPCE
jgi:hypothetical protein